MQLRIEFRESSVPTKRVFGIYEAAIVRNAISIQKNNRHPHNFVESGSFILDAIDRPMLPFSASVSGRRGEFSAAGRGSDVIQPGSATKAATAKVSCGNFQFIVTFPPVQKFRNAQRAGRALGNFAFDDNLVAAREIAQQFKDDRAKRPEDEDSENAHSNANRKAGLTRFR
jgi:hypothetical protein